MDAVLNAFQWGNERSVLLIDGLDRLGNALGDAGMLDAFRSMCDGVRFNDHVALVTTDLEMFETAVQRRLLRRDLLRHPTWRLGPTIPTACGTILFSCTRRGRGAVVGRTN